MKPADIRQKAWEGAECHWSEVIFNVINEEGKNRIKETEGTVKTTEQEQDNGQ